MFQTIIGDDIERAANWLREGELVGLPTETVYGLAANATSEAAVRKVFAVKRRPLHNPLIVHVDRIEKIHPYVTHIPEPARILLRELTPGPLTLLLASNRVLPAVVNNGRRELAFRIPAHPMAQELLSVLDFPLVAPSANAFTGISPTQPAHVRKYFDGQIPYILDGGSCTVGIESTVVGFDREGMPVIYREGACSRETIEALVGPVRAKSVAAEADAPAPGMMSFHYAPVTPLVLTERGADLPKSIDPGRVGLIRLSGYHDALPREQQFLLSPSASPEEAARHLYEALHRLDEMELELIIAEKLPDIGLGRAINDRLQRAAHPSPDRDQAISPTIN